MTRSALPRICLLALIWKSSFLWIKLADRGFSPVEATLARLALGADVLFAMVAARREPVPRSARIWAHITVAALFANAVPYLLFAIAEQHVNSPMAGIINAPTPLSTRGAGAGGAAPEDGDELAGGQADRRVLLGGTDLHAMERRGRADLTRWAGMPGRLDQLRHQLHLYGQVPGPPGIGPVVLSTCQLAAAAVMLAIAVAVSGVRSPHVTPVSVAAIAVLGVTGTGFAYVLNFQIITSEGATIASTVTYLLPVVAIVLGVLVPNETITVIVLGGIALVLAG